jgi:hypothetical protein
MFKQGHDAPSPIQKWNARVQHCEYALQLSHTVLLLLQEYPFNQTLNTSLYC